eukprot:TRINITY_DN4139_c0_g1_i2.p1 TRINITY_DN4139_c0_g1~~TRINITY_DN4139_c0_g1_i2.p1  ORF type:complete len:397 (+),score=59.18 TRINITY_DN4139_c0_g1_i2:68-1192(+)
MMWITYCYLALIFVIVYTMGCGDRDCHRGGVVEKLHNFLNGGICNCFRTNISRFFGKKCLKCCEKVEDHCCWEPNPYVQIFYCTLILGGYFIWWTNAVPLIPGPYIPEYYKTITHFGVVIDLAIFFWCCASDPGTITSKTYKTYKNSFKFDNILYSPGKECSTCKVARPARSKHCRICNSCVGEKNIRLFLLFLFSSGVLTLWACYMCACISLGEFKQRQIIKMGYFDSQKRWIPAPTYAMISYLLDVTGLVMPLGLFCGAATLAIFAFLSYHVYLVVRNTTTNETFKRKELSRAVRIAQNNKRKGKPQERTQSDKTQSKEAKADDSKEKTYTIADDVLMSLDPNNLPNHYNKGIIGNFYEAIYPPCTRVKSND